jgi:alpha-beta hydrolase superfamily lysophospholipase
VGAAPQDPAPSRALYLEAADEPFLVRYDAPAGPVQRAVLLVPPFGWEEICSYRPRRSWAHHLAQRGAAVARLDLPGSGDSAGGPLDGGRVEAWTEAVAVAARWLAAQAGPEARVTLVGLGLGGLIGWRAAAAGAPVDDLVLWGAAGRGRSLVREVKAFSRLERSKLAELNPGRELPADDDGSLTAAGFVLSAETIAALGAVDVAELPLPAGAAGRRVLLAGRDGSAPDAVLAEAAGARGADLQVLAGEGWGAMMAEPGSAAAPWATIAAVDTWLEAAPPAPVRGPEAGAPVAAGSATLDGGTVRETPIRVGGADGVLAEPAAADAAPAPMTLVLLNAGSVRRVGPNRMWVELARRWAARGVPSVRLDLAGIGEADGPESMDGVVAAYFEPVFVPQVRAVLDELEAGAPGTRFGALGLCSGAYWAVQAAAADRRIPHIYLLNIRALVWEEGLVELRDAGKLGYLTRGSTYRRVLRGDIPLRRGAEIGAAVARRVWRAALARLARGTARAAPASAEAVAADPVDALLDRLHDAGVRPYLLFTGAEPVHEELERSGRLALQPERWPNMRLDTLLELRDVHTFQTRALQREAHARVDAAIAADLAALRPVS